MAGVQEMIKNSDRCISAPAAMSAPAAQEADTDKVRKCISAPAASGLQWPGVVGADIKVRNTFLYVEMQDVDEEVAFLQACRRRNSHSCPLPSLSMEPAPEESPRLPADADSSRNDYFEPEPAMEPAPEQPTAKELGLQLEPSPDQTVAKALGLQVKDTMQRMEAAPNYEVAGHQAGFQELMAMSIAKHHSRGRRADAVVQKAICARTSRRNRGDNNRLWCHVYMNPCMLEPGFDLVQKVIGRTGCNTRAIFESTGTKIRVRGRGSGHIEHRLGREAPVPLMVALAAESDCPEGFSRAVVLTKELLQDTEKRFHGFCAKKGLPVPTMPLFSIGDSSQRSLAILCPADLEGMQVCLQGRI